MKKKVVRNIVFASVMILYVCVPAYMIYSYHSTLVLGNVYRFKPQPVDPYDAFRGKYITLSFVENNINYDTTGYRYRKGETIYLELGNDSSGYVSYRRICKTPPEDSDYLKTHVEWEWVDTTGHIVFDLPFDRYYLPEDMAKKAEDAYLENMSWDPAGRDSSVYVDVRVREGIAVIEELYLKGIPVKEYIHKLDVEKK